MPKTRKIFAIPAARPWRLALALLAGAVVAGCGPTYSPNTYSATAVQQANKVDQAVVVGVRPIDISAQTNIGTLAGGGAGGIAGATTGDTLGIGSALGALSGSVIGGIVGSTVEHQTSDTTGFEYIVRKSNGELMSVTQKDATPLAIGTHVLIIAGNQARIVPDYTVAIEPEKQAAPVAHSDSPAPQAHAELTPPQASAGPAQAVPVPSKEAEAAPVSAHVAITETPLPKTEPEAAAEPEAMPPATPAVAPSEPPGQTEQP